MRKVKTNPERPWLTSTGVEASTQELLKISKSWGPTTWAAYLDWFETTPRELLVTPAAYQTICDEQTESIFEQFSQESCPESKVLCEKALSMVSDNESVVLRKVFLEGRSIREIAFEVGRPKSTINDLKYKGILRLKRGIDGKNSDVCQFMITKYHSGKWQRLLESMRAKSARSCTIGLRSSQRIG